MSRSFPPSGTPQGQVLRESWWTSILRAAQSALITERGEPLRDLANMTLIAFILSENNYEDRFDGFDDFKDSAIETAAAMAKDLNEKYQELGELLKPPELKAEHDKIKRRLKLVK